MSDNPEYDAFKPWFLKRLAAGLFVAAVLMLAFGAAYTHFSGVTMGMHGWVAMTIGIFVSFAIAGTLTAVMVLGRRNGGDEAAGGIDWE